MEPKQNVICPFCGKDIPPESRYCLFCGQDLAGQSDLQKADSFTDPDATIQFCKSCGVIIPPYSKYCPVCGERQRRSSPQVRESPKHRMRDLMSSGTKVGWSVGAVWVKIMVYSPFLMSCSLTFVSTRRTSLIRILSPLSLPSQSSSSRVRALSMEGARLFSVAFCSSNNGSG